ncbi:MAG: peptidase M20, partial [Gemmatimonadota bacterium]
MPCTNPFWRSVLILLVAATPLAAQGPDPAAVRQQIRSYREANEARILSELRDLLALPNVASDLGDIQRNARHLVGLLEQRGIAARILDLGDAPPAVYGELNTPGATRTLVLYAHFDGQPVDRTKWA